MVDQWYYARAGKQAGPVSPEDLSTLAASGQLSPTDMVWKEGMQTWVPAERLTGLFTAMPAMTVPPSLPPAGPVATLASVREKAAKPSTAMPWTWIGGTVALMLLVGLAFLFLPGARNAGNNETNSGAFENYICDNPKFVGHIDFARERNSDFYKGLTATDTARLEQSLSRPGVGSCQVSPNGVPCSMLAWAKMALTRFSCSPKLVARRVGRSSQERNPDGWRATECGGH